MSYTIVQRRRVIVQCKQIFRIVVGNTIKWCEFTLQRSFISNSQRHLVVSDTAFIDCHEIHFTVILLPDVYFVFTSEQLKVNYVFQNMSHIRRFCSKQIVSESDIGKIKLFLCLQKYFIKGLVAGAVKT